MSSFRFGAGGSFGNGSCLACLCFFLIGQEIQHESSIDGGISVVGSDTFPVAAKIVSERTLQVLLLAVQLPLPLVYGSGNTQRLRIFGLTEVLARYGSRFLQNIEGTIELLIGRKIRVLVGAEGVLLNDGEMLLLFNLSDTRVSTRPGKDAAGQPKGSLFFFGFFASASNSKGAAFCPRRTALALRMLSLSLLLPGSADSTYCLLCHGLFALGRRRRATAPPLDHWLIGVSDSRTS